MNKAEVFKSLEEKAKRLKGIAQDGRIENIKDKDKYYYWLGYDSSVIDLFEYISLAAKMTNDEARNMLDVFKLMLEKNMLIAERWKGNSEYDQGKYDCLNMFLAEVWEIEKDIIIELIEQNVY